MPEEARLPRPTLQVLSRLHRSYAGERRRLARYLHDQVAHTLVIALNSLELHEAHIQDDPAHALDLLRGAMGTVRQALEAVRALSLDLRGHEVDDGLESALTEYLRTIAAPNVQWTVQVTGHEAGLPEDVRDELYLILREAAHNTLIHASARHLEIVVETGPDSVRAVAKDDGRGFDVDRHVAGSGLAGMRERAQLLGGTTEVASRPGGGTRIAVEIPLLTEAEREG
jgi:signal transduction histidine kinase